MDAALEAPPDFETIKVLAGLIEAELELLPTQSAPNKRVTIYNQTIRLSNAAGLFVVVAFLYERAFAKSLRYANDVTSEGSLLEIQTRNLQETFQIDVFSADDQARIRKDDVLFALGGTEAQQLQEKWAFKIGELPSSFADLSGVEASVRLNRYAITFNALRAKTRIRRTPAFTIFQNPPRGITINP